MTLFELYFSLSVVILGLSLTNIAASLHRLALAGRRVRWAPEPLLQAVLITLIIMQVWLDYWFMRDLASLSFAGAFIGMIRLMTLYFAAASCLPDPDLVGIERPFDLHDYYYRTRALSYGAMIVGLLLFNLGAILNGYREWIGLVQGLLIGPALYGLLIWTRRRWVHLSILLLILGLYGTDTLLRTIKA